MTNYLHGSFRFGCGCGDDDDERFGQILQFSLKSKEDTHVGQKTKQYVDNSLDFFSHQKYEISFNSFKVGSVGAVPLLLLLMLLLLLL